MLEQVPRKEQATKLDWPTIGYHFQQSTYISIGWDWFLVFSAKLADPALLLSVLYAGFKVTNPDLAGRLPSIVDAVVNVGQNIALDAAGFGLLVDAARAEKEGNTKGATSARFIAYTLLSMMVVNMGLASLARSFGWQEQNYAWLIGILLIVRAILSVAYGVVSRSLHKSEKEIEGEEVVNVVSVCERVDQIETFIKNAERMYDQQVNSITDGIQSVTTMQHYCIEVLEKLQASKLVPVQESGQPETKKKQKRVKEPIELPQKEHISTLSKDIDKKQFVFDCLKENSKTTISAMQERASNDRWRLSVGTASSYRKEYFKQNSVGMSEAESNHIETDEAESEEREEEVAPANLMV